MIREISVDSGEVAAAKGASLLCARAIGSCVVVAAYDPEAGIGGMAHAMLPGASPERRASANAKYAEDAIEELLCKMRALGGDGSRALACLVGGGNVLGDGHDSPGAEIVESLRAILGRAGVTTVAMETGGMQRRSCVLDVGRGRVTYTVGDSERRVLWETAPTVLSRPIALGNKSGGEKEVRA